MRIAVAQIDTKVGDLSGNEALILRAVERAEAAAADLLLVPEMAVSGYPSQDLAERDDFVRHSCCVVERIARRCTRVAALVGHLAFNESGTGRRLHNSVSLCADGRVATRIHKTLLPSYDVFDEARFFEPAAERRVVEIAGVPVAVTICEDLWSLYGLPERRPYALDPLTELLGQGPRLVVNVSASPFHLGKPRERQAVMEQQARRAGLPLVYCNLVGGNDGVIFDGHSLVLDGDGRVRHGLAPFAEDFCVVDVDLDRAGRGEPGVRVVEDDSADARPVDERCEEQEAHDALCLGIRDYMTKSGFRQAVIGLSGGIDSALVATLAADAIGPENVLGVGMPSAISSEHSRADARALAENLGIAFREVPIAPIVDAYEAALKPHFGGRPEDTTEENLQARTRGNILMALSNKLGHLLLSTGNKSEMSVGYCTLYGDMAGGLAVLGDLPKTLVYGVSRWLNRDGVRIPVSTLTKPPSAELKPGQLDQDTLPPYDALDEVIRLYIEEGRSVPEILATGLDEESVRWVVSRIDRQEYKRRQTAPVLKVTSRAYGTGRRYPVVQGFDPFSSPCDAS